MVDVVSIVIAVISLVGSILSAGITALVTLHSDRTKRLSDSAKLVSKYRDPLLLASIDLQSRLYNILDQGVISYYNDINQQDFVTLYTAFLVGQYFSWAHILRRKIQFFSFSTDKTNKKLSRTIEAIQKSFSTDKYGPNEKLFMLWRGQQIAIGEVMTIAEGEELYCMGYSTFAERFKSGDVGFKKWFEPITEGITRLVEAYSDKRPLPANRLRRLQHVMVDLINILDPPRSESGTANRRKVAAAPFCDCLNCPANQSSESNVA